MKKVYEAPEFLSEDVLNDINESLDNTTGDPLPDEGGDDPDPSFDFFDVLS